LIVTVTLNAALAVSYEATALTFSEPGKPCEPGELTRATYRASGRGVAAARVLQKFGHDVLATGLAGGTAGELIAADLARDGIESDFTRIGRESRRIFAITEHETSRGLRLREAGPYVTTEELGRFASDFRRLLEGATAVVMSGSLPPGLPSDIYGSLVSYAAAAGVPVIVDADGEAVAHGARRGPDLVITGADTPLGPGPGAVVTAGDGALRVVTGDGWWTAELDAEKTGGRGELVGGRTGDRGALVAGMVPGLLLGWSWPDRVRHAVALAASTGPFGDVDLGRYEELLSGDAIRVTAKDLSASATVSDLAILRKVITSSRDVCYRPGVRTSLSVNPKAPTEWRVSVYKRRIVLGGAAPAAMLALGIFAAGPAMAATSTPTLAQAHTAVVTSALPAGLVSQLPGVSGAASMVQGMTGNVPVASSLASVGNGAVQNATSPSGIQSVTGQLPNASAVTNGLGSATPSGVSNAVSSATGQSGPQNPASDANAGGLGNLGSATSNLPGVGQASGLLDGLGATNGQSPNLNSVTGTLGDATGVTSGLTSGGGALSSLG
jgi:tagatose 6-phosphate kinase